MDIAGITLTQSQLWQLAGSSLLAALLMLWTRRFLVRRQLFKICGVPTSSYRLVGTTQLWFGRPVKLRKYNLHGDPSNVFLKKDGKSAYVCHFNPRFFKGRVKVRERYQLLLLMGLVNEIYSPERIQGAILYRDQLEPIKFEPVIYKQLRDLQDEYCTAIENWEAPNARPLFNRDQGL